jgi:PAS domain S-box-containing protein
MSAPLDTDSSLSTELVDLRRQVFELQQALADARHSYAPAHISAHKKLELVQQDLRDTLEAQVRERTAGLEQAVTDLKQEVERRQLAESAIKASEQRYWSLYEQNPFMYFTLTAGGTVLSVNSFGADQLGYLKEDLIGQSIMKLFDPSDRETVLTQLKDCAAGPYTLFQCEVQKIRKDGSRLWVRERARAIHDQTGQILVLIVCEDITELKRTENQLHETTRLLHTLVKKSALPLISLDRDACVTSWNQAATHLFGWSEQEVLGRELPYIQPGEEAAADALWQAGTRGEVAGPIELKRRRKDGAILDLLLWPVFVYDEFKQVSVAVGIYVDQSDLKRAEEALRASERRLQRFVAEAPVGLCILDENWRAISANKAFCELTGYEEREVIGSTYALYTHPEDLSANIVLTDEFFRGIRSEYTYEKRYIRKSGEIIWVSVKATRVELSGHAGPLLLAAVQDITARKLAMEERERLSRDLHDNILQALYAVGMQLEACKLSMGKSLRRSKIHMTQAVDQLNNLMLDVRRFIALLTQRTAAEPDFGQALRQLIASMSGAGQSTPELELTNPVLSFITPKLGEQLLNIVREALSNSTRHAHASHRWVRLSLADNAIHLIIGDNGVGFSTKRKRRAGHGLGNMAVRAKQISATFTLKSAPGKGTSVLVDVPLKKGNVYE